MNRVEPSPAQRQQILPAILLTLVVGLTGCAAFNVDFSSTPEGATVSGIDGRTLGVTPFSMKFEDDGTFGFLFRKAGFNEERVNKTMARDSRVHVVLTTNETRLAIETVPANAGVQVFAGNRPIRWAGANSVTDHGSPAFLLNDNALWNGAGTVQLTITIQAPGHVSHTEQVTVKRGTSHSLSYVLTETTARVDIESTPPGALVYDRRLGYIGTTPLSRTFSRTELERIADDAELVDQSSRLHLTFKRDGRDPFTKSFVIRLQDGVQKLAVELP